jgi:hypothetical protein
VTFQSNFQCTGGGNYIAFEQFYPQREDALAPEDAYLPSGSSAVSGGALGGNWILFGNMLDCENAGSYAKFSSLDGSIGIHTGAIGSLVSRLTLAHETFHSVTGLPDGIPNIEGTIGDSSNLGAAVLETWCPEVPEDPAAVNVAWSWLDAPPWVWCLMPSGRLQISTRRRCHAAMHGQSLVACPIPEDFNSCFTLDPTGLLE